MAEKPKRKAASTFIVVLDANALVPAAPRDTLLRAAEAGLYRLAWSDEILAEVERNLVEHEMTSVEDARDLIETMRSFFVEALITGYEALVLSMTNDAKDRHVLAAAVRAHAQVIVTENLPDFPDSALALYGIEAQSLDQFLTHLFWLSPERMTQIVVEQAADLEEPPMSPDEVLAELGRQAPTFVELVAARLW